MLDEKVKELMIIEARAREKLHANHASNRPLSEDYELVGLMGEAEFSRVFRQPMDLERKPGGDKGIDFIVPLRFKVDVKTFRKPKNLIHEVGKVVADIYVLGSYEDDESKPELLGWEWGRNLAAAPTRDFGYGVINHFIPRDELRKMIELEERVMHLR